MSKLNIVIPQGTDYSKTFSLLDANGATYDTSGYAVSAKMKRHYASANSIAFSTALSNGQVILSLTRVQTSNVEHGRYVYDIELTDTSNNVTREYEGIATITPETTT